MTGTDIETMGGAGSGGAGSGVRAALAAILLLLPLQFSMAQPFEVGTGARIDCAAGSCQSQAITAMADIPTPQVETLRNIAYQLNREVTVESRLSKIADAMARADASGLVSITLELRDEPFDFTQLRHARGGADRSHLIQVRRAQLAESQQRIADLVETNGGGSPLAVGSQTRSRSWCQ